MISNTITDGRGRKLRAEVTTKQALKVATEPYHTYAAAAVLFTNPTYGLDMNYNFSNEGAGNSNEIIHNGIDSVEWTASAIVGGSWTFNSTANPDTGTKNIELSVGAIGDTAQFDRGSNVTMDNHTGISGRIYITTQGNPNANLAIYAWDTTTSSIVGTAVDIFDYVDVGTLLVYQTFAIPLADMGLTGATFDAIRIEQAGVIGGTIADLDNITLNDPTGGTAIGTTVYTMQPGKSSRWLLHGFIVNMADAYAGTVTDGTMPGLSYDALLGESALSSPILYQVYDNDIVTFAATFNKMIDFFLFGNPRFSSASDGTNTWLNIYVGLNSPIVLNGDENDRITLTLSDDLSGLLYFRWTANASQQDLPEALA
jgi:hypothetical protein